VRAGSRASVLAAVAVAFTLTAKVDANPATPAAPTLREAWIARIVYGTVVRARPGGPIIGSVGTRARWNGGPVGLLVLGTASDRRGSLWLRVRLPRRPNGTNGWIRSDFAQLTPTGYRIAVSIRHRTVRLLYRGHVIRRYGAVVGRPGLETPRGLFSVSERVPQPNPHGFLGPWALLLTAYSPTLKSYGGGPGQIALHGRDGTSLADPLGSARSHGCSRIPNIGIQLLARVAREGTPVDILQ
jgi:L,D-transpeptidase-like protein